MLTRYQMTLDVPHGARPRAEWSYHLYAALLERLPKAFGESVHRDDATPLSQFVTLREDGSVLWTVSLLGEESENAACPLLEGAGASR